MGGGAWPFLVGGVICLVNSVNERDLNLLNSCLNCSSKSSESARDSVGLVRVTAHWEGWTLAKDLLSDSVFGNFLEGLSAFSWWKFEAITGL